MTCQSYGLVQNIEIYDIHHKCDINFHPVFLYWKCKQYLEFEFC